MTVYRTMENKPGVPIITLQQACMLSVYKNIHILGKLDGSFPVFPIWLNSAFRSTLIWH